MRCALRGSAPKAGHYADDQEAEIRRLLALGASEVHWDGRPDDADYVIMQDPEGNRFCVIDAADWSGWDVHGRGPAAAQ